MEGLRKYLASLGLDEESDPEEVASAKAEYWKRYYREYQAQRRKDRKRIELSLSKDQFERISAEAKRYETTPASFAVKAVFGYLDRRYLVPDATSVRDLELGIRRIGSNVNQLVKHCHTRGSVEVKDIERINDFLRELEAQITESLRDPPLTGEVQ